MAIVRPVGAGPSARWQKTATVDMLFGAMLVVWGAAAGLGALASWTPCLGGDPDRAACLELISSSEQFNRSGLVWTIAIVMLIVGVCLSSNRRWFAVGAVVIVIFNPVFDRGFTWAWSTADTNPGVGVFPGLAIAGVGFFVLTMSRRRRVDDRSAA
ncbi:hypothetical protein [Microbacterium sp. SLBN-146]|uniref:hypothetical protein n=1 Tax=Microbacterium sp. SLBN-146 TaxID=2768457 RepID=UPI001150E0A9|nr:hypothetical protein [Microbacterium sp. SLBN-146]TQJ31554.1 hypothetical protein FBY39_2033 [Microbacterium sp. SLBN-146]